MAAANSFLSTPSARRATAHLARCVTAGTFLSTPSARRATALRPTLAAAFINFYPRPPRGGRLAGWSYGLGLRYISIHALREEGDRFSSTKVPQNRYFYPRPPRGGRPGVLSRALLVDDFYPRPPRGGRRGGALRDVQAKIFLSTPSARRATAGADRSKVDA